MEQAITWKPDSFTAIEIQSKIDSKEFVVPKYQRGCVWNKKKKDEFIDTLKRGLPFGTILLYHDSEKGQYRIIDGLQRASTIWNFVNQPAPFFNEDDIEDNLPKELAKVTGVSNYSALVDGIRDHLIQWVRDSFSSMDEVKDIQYNDYAIAFTKVYPSAKGKELEIVAIVKPTLKQFKDFMEQHINSKAKDYGKILET